MTTMVGYKKIYTKSAVGTRNGQMGHGILHMEETGLGIIRSPTLAHWRIFGLFGQMCGCGLIEASGPIHSLQFISRSGRTIQYFNGSSGIFS